MIFVLSYIFLIHSASTQQACNLYCNKQLQSGPTIQPVIKKQRLREKRGPMEVPGKKGQKGDMCRCNCTVLERL